MAPPWPLVMFLLIWKLQAPASPSVPALRRCGWRRARAHRQRELAACVRGEALFELLRLRRPGQPTDLPLHSTSSTRYRGEEGRPSARAARAAAAASVRAWPARPPTLLESAWPGRLLRLRDTRPTRAHRGSPPCRPVCTTATGRHRRLPT